MASDEILTGEGVALQVGSASVLARAVGWLIDAAVVVSVLVGLFVLVSWLAGDLLDLAAAQAFLVAVPVLAFIGTPMAVETLTRGRSLGKLAMGLQVIRDDGGPVRLRHAGIRALIGVFELWMLLGGLAFFVSMMNDRGKRVGDYLAGTYVARVRGVQSSAVALFMPPELAGWALRTDTRPLPDGLALRARQFLGRAHQFPPPIRHRLGLRLAAQLELFVSPAPPPATHPESFIAAVLSERQRREQLAHSRRQPRLQQQLAGIETLPYSVADPDS